MNILKGQALTKEQKMADYLEIAKQKFDALKDKKDVLILAVDAQEESFPF